MPPTQSPRTAVTTPIIARLILFALPPVIVAAVFFLGHDRSTKGLLIALSMGCFAASLSFYLAFCLRAATSQSAASGGSFAKSFAKNAGLFGLALAAFAIALFLPTDNANAAPQGDNPSLSEGIDSIGCATLAMFFGPILLGFLLRETT